MTDWIPETQFAPARGARLAYQKFGEGDHRILAIPPLAQNIEIAWEWPDVRAMLERFASFSEYVVFDKRGTGASDRHSQVPGLDERVEDIRADPAGLAAYFPTVETVVIAPPLEGGIVVEGTGALNTPGRYGIICAIPTGADPQEYLAAAAESEGGPPQVDGGPPHFVEGMWGELIVDG